MIYAKVQAGIGKSVCEDSVIIGSKVISDEATVEGIPSHGFIGVADGVGGNRSGDIASTHLLALLSEITCSEEQLHDSLCEANAHLIEESKSNPLYEDMATTLSAIYIGGKEKRIVHIGNTRVYVVQGHYLKQLTADHTIYNWLNSMGRKEEAEASNKNEITNCFGGGNEELLSKLQILPLSDSKIFLLTSDGIHDYVSQDDMEEILNADLSGEEKCEELIKRALNAGSKDDMSAVLIDAQEEDDGI